MLLHKDKDTFQELVIATASDLGLENFQVEKVLVHRNLNLTFNLNNGIEIDI